MRFVTGSEDWRNIKEVLQKLSSELHRAEADRLKLLIQQSLAEYTPDLDGVRKTVRKPITGDEIKSQPEPKLAANLAAGVVRPVASDGVGKN
jgi:hypothetical protein